MINLPSAVLSESQKDATWPVRLFEITGADGSILRYTDADLDVYQNGKIWTPNGMSYSKVKNNLDFETDTYDVSIDNHNDGMTAWSLQADQRGGQVAVFKGFLNGVTDANGRLLPIGDFALLLFYGTLASIEISNEASLKVKSNIDLHQQIGPSAMQEVTCRFRFKDVNCGYSGAETSCNYTYGRCITLNNTARFGGYRRLNSDSKYL